MAASADQTRVIEQPDQFQCRAYPVVGSDIIYRHTVVGLNVSTGYARPFTAGDIVLGVSTEHVDNSSGSAGDLSVTVMKEAVIEIPVSGASAITNRGARVYVTDDNTFTLTASTNTLFGYVEEWKVSTTCKVRFDATNVGANLAPLTEDSSAIGGTNDGDLPDLDATVQALTDSTGGTPATTIANLADGSTYSNDHAAIENNFASLTNEITALTADNVALRAAIRELATKLNEVINVQGS